MPCLTATSRGGMIRAAWFQWCLVAAGCLVGSHVDAAPLVAGYERFGRPFVEAEGVAESAGVAAKAAPLSQIESGDPSAAEQLLPLVYDELRKLAAARLAGQPAAAASH